MTLKSLLLISSFKNKSAKVRAVYITSFIAIIIAFLYLFSVIAIGNQSFNPSDPSSRIQILNSTPKWNLVKHSGAEANYKFYAMNGSDKKTHLGWATNTNDGAKTIYNCNGTVIKDDKNKDLTSAWGSAKVDLGNGTKLNGYDLDLTSAASVNIDDCVKLGNTSSVALYNDTTFIQYSIDNSGIFNMNVSLKKYLNGNWENPIGLTAYFDNQTYKIKATDTFGFTNDTYQFTYDSPTQLNRLGNDFYTDAGGNRAKIRLGDICDNKYDTLTNSSFNSELNITTNNTYQSLRFSPNCVYNLTRATQLKVTFLGELNTTTNSVEIDPFTDATCTTGDLQTTCNLNAGYTFSNGELINGTGNLIINSSGYITNTNNQTSVVLNFSTITILSGGYIKGGNITIYTNNLTVNSGGKIDVSGLGYQGGVSALSVCKGIGPGAEAAGSQSGSAGYGGLGGVGFNGGFGLPYGSFLNPNDYGSGGNCGWTTQGGHGGGLIRIFATDTLTMNGNINVSGTDGAPNDPNAQASGGGSGGSIYINTTNLIGNGSILAKGGAGGSGIYKAGGGSGGRVAISYLTSTFNPSPSNVQGGTGVSPAASGEAGTFILYNNTEAYIAGGWQTKIDDVNTTFHTTGGNTFIWNFMNVNITFNNVNQSLRNKTDLIFGNNVNINNMNLRCYGGNVTLNISAINLVIPSTAKIDLTGCGYEGPASVSFGTATTGLQHGSDGYGGPGKGALTGGAGGGGYGGAGGAGNTAAGGSAYGTAAGPLDWGSTGGYGYLIATNPPAIGGGLIKITTSGTLTLNGTLQSGGTNGFTSCGNAAASGGGSGGGIFINASILAGNATLINATGGRGGSCGAGSYNGGGGGGGRVAVYCGNGANYVGVLNATVTGGVNVSANSVSGSVGTVYWNATSCPSAPADVAPLVYLLSPSNNSKTTQSVNYFYANHTDDLGLIGTNLTIWNSTGSIIGINNTAITGISNTTNLSFTLPYNDVFKWNYNTFDNGGFNSWNSTNFTLTFDNTPPSVNTLNEYPSDPATYSQGATYSFNATITDVLSSIGTVLLNFSNILYPTSNGAGSIYNTSIINLAAGTYNYNWIANDSLGNLNSTSNGTYTINKASGTGSLLINGTAGNQTAIYRVQTNVSITSTNTFTLYENGADITAQNNILRLLSVGNYNFTVIFNTHENYTTPSSIERWSHISKANGVVYTYLNNSRANITLEVGSNLLINSSLITGLFGSLNLTQDGVQLNYSTTNNLTYTQTFNTLGTFIISTNYSGNANYTSAVESWNITVRDTTIPKVYLLSPANGSAVSPLVYFYSNHTDNYQLKNTTLYLWNSTGSLINTNFTTITGTSNTANLSLTLPYLGTFFWNYNTFDTSHNNAWNNSNFTIVYSDATKPLIQFVPVTETNNTNLNRNNIEANVTASDETSLASIVINVYNSTGLFYTNTSTTSPLYVNVTSMPDGRYYFNATATDSATNTNTTETRTVLIDTTKPLIQFVSPTETAGAYLNRSNIVINVTSTDTNLVNITIRLYNSTALINTSTTTSSSNYINVTSLPDGLYFFNATSIDLAGNINNTITRNVTIDTTYPLIDWGIGTLPDYSNISQSNVYLNTTWTEVNPNTVTFWVNGVSHINSIPPNVYADNYTGLADGTMTYYVVICDLANQCNQTSTRTITLDTTRPLISFTSPTQTSGVNLSRNYIESNVTINETNFKNITFNLYNTTSLVNSTFYSTQILYLNWSSLPNGIYTYNVTVLDIVGLSNSTETRTITLDTTSPIVNLISPTNNTKSTSATHSFNSTFTDNIALVNSTFYLWNSTNSLINTTIQSKTGTSNSMNLSVILPYNDIFKWNYFVCDITSCAFNLTNFTITYDSTNPSASYVLPTHNSSIVLYTNKIKVNVTASDNIALDTITIRLYNGSQSLLYTNTSSTSPYYVEYPNLNANGHKYYFNVTVNDTLNNLVNLATRNVTLDTTPINFTNPLNDSGHTAGVFGTTAETLNGETTTWVYKFLTSWITPAGNPQSSFTDAQTIAAGTYNWTVNATDTEGNIVQWIEYGVVFSATGGGAYTCDIRASAIRTSASYVLISVATLGSIGTPENHALTTNCYDGNGTNITSPTFTNLRTGYYQANFTNNGSGSCDIRDSGASCGHTTVTWTDYGASVTTTSSGSSSSGGSSGYLPTPFVTDSYLCNRTYGYILEHGQFDKTNILQLINEMNDETYRLYDIDITEDYIDDWQSKCSDVIMRTLEPDYVCRQSYLFLKSNPAGFTAEKVIELRDKIRNEKTVKLSYSLMANYLNNYNELCFVKGYSPIVKASEIKSPILFASASGLESCSIDFIAEDWYIPITRINMNLDSCTSINLYKLIFKLQNGGTDSVDIIGIRVVTTIPLLIIVIILLILAIIKYRIENIRGFNLFNRKKKKQETNEKEDKVSPPEYKSVEYDTY